MRMNATSDGKALKVNISIEADNAVEYGIALSIMGAAKAHLDAMCTAQKANVNPDKTKVIA